jgi:hypothetical protein
MALPVGARNTIRELTHHAEDAAWQAKHNSIYWASQSSNAVLMRLATFLFGRMSREELMHDQRLHSAHPASQKQIEFIEPKHTTIEEFVTDVCENLVAQGHTRYGNRSTQWAIANFIKLTAELVTKRLNEQQQSI